jgi:hypothetical protein
MPLLERCIIGYEHREESTNDRRDDHMLAYLLAATLAGAPCANPSIIATNVQSVANNGQLNHYTIAIEVQNVGDLEQPGNLLQSIDVFKDGQRIDRIGLQPLHPGQMQTVTFGFDRASDAGDGTTRLTFAIDLNGQSGDNVDCHAGTETAKIRF